MFRLCLLFLLIPPLLNGQTASKPDPWSRMKFLEGKWEGTGSGEPGVSTVEREYRFVLGGKFLFVQSKSTYAPQEKNPRGEVHEEWGLFSFDRRRKSFVLRQFHVEGFVNQFVLDSTFSDSTTLVFVTESIENIAPDWKARETYRMLGEDEFIEIFELTPPGKEFAVYSENRLKRKQ